MAVEEASQGEYLSKVIETPKVWRSEYEGKPIVEFEAWVSTEMLDRDGEIIRMAGWRKPSLNKAKLLLFHDYYELPIGKPYWTIKKEEGDKKGLYTRGRMGPQMHGLAAGELLLQGDMDSFSVGFNWFKRIFDAEADGNKTPYFEYIDQELYEYSLVNIPSNPEATIAMQRMLNDARDVKDSMAIIKSFNNQKNGVIRRDSYTVKESKSVIPYHDYGNADEGESWDGPGTVAQCDVVKLKKICSWYDSENPDVKSSYKLPHHNVNLKAVWRGCAAAMGRLNQTDIPEEEKKGCYNHLTKHYKDFDKEPPEYEKAIGTLEEAYFEAYIDGKRTYGLDAIKAIRGYIFDGSAKKDEVDSQDYDDGIVIDDDDIDLDYIEVEVDALGDDGNTSDSIGVEVLVGTGDDAGIEVEI